MKKLNQKVIFKKLGSTTLVSLLFLLCLKPEVVTIDTNMDDESNFSERVNGTYILRQTYK